MRAVLYLNVDQFTNGHPPPKAVEEKMKKHIDDCNNSVKAWYPGLKILTIPVQGGQETRLELMSETGQNVETAVVQLIDQLKEYGPELVKLLQEAAQ